MKGRLILIILAVVTLLLLLQGCATPVTQASMTPTHLGSHRQTGKTLVVRPVVIRPQPGIGLVDTIHSMPDAAQYREAIVTTLGHTGLFSEVRTEGDADYVLATDVVGERLIGGLNNIGMFFIRYELTNTASGRAAWQENIFSHAMLSASEMPLGGTRASRVIELGVSDNMSQLAARLADALSTQN
jgi:hypothetical protein